MPPSVFRPYLMLAMATTIGSLVASDATSVSSNERLVFSLDATSVSSSERVVFSVADVAVDKSLVVAGQYLQVGAAVAGPPTASGIEVEAIVDGTTTLPLTYNDSRTTSGGTPYHTYLGRKVFTSTGKRTIGARARQGVSAAWTNSAKTANATVQPISLSVVGPATAVAGGAAVTFTVSADAWPVEGYQSNFYISDNVGYTNIPFTGSAVSKALSLPGARTYYVAFRSSDGINVMGTSPTYTIQVDATATDPIISGPTSLTANLGDQVTATYSADQSVSTWDVDLTWLSISKGVLTGTPPDTGVFNATISATASTGGRVGRLPISVRVDSPVQPPVVNRLVIPPSILASATTTILIEGTNLPPTLDLSARYGTIEQINSSSVSISALYTAPATPCNDTITVTVGTIAPVRGSIEVVADTTPVISAIACAATMRPSSTMAVVVAGRNLAETLLVSVTPSSATIQAVGRDPAPSTTRAFVLTAPATEGTLTVSAKIAGATASPKSVSVMVTDPPPTLNATQSRPGVMQATMSFSPDGHAGVWTLVAPGGEVLWEASNPSGEIEVPYVARGLQTTVELRKGGTVKASATAELVVPATPNAPGLIILGLEEIARAAIATYGVQPFLKSTPVTVAARGETPTIAPRELLNLAATERLGGAPVMLFKRFQIGPMAAALDDLAQAFLILPTNDPVQAARLSKAIEQELIIALRGEGIDLVFKNGQWRLPPGTTLTRSKVLTALGKMFTKLDTSASILVDGVPVSAFRGNVAKMLGTLRSSVQNGQFIKTLLDAMSTSGRLAEEKLGRLATTVQDSYKALLLRAEVEALRGAGVARTAVATRLRVLNGIRATAGEAKLVQRTVKGRIGAVIALGIITAAVVPGVVQANSVVASDGSQGDPVLYESVDAVPIESAAEQHIVQQQMNVDIRDASADIVGELIMSPFVILDAMSWWANESMGPDLSNRDLVGSALYYYEHGARDYIKSGYTETYKLFWDYVDPMSWFTSPPPTTPTQDRWTPKAGAPIDHTYRQILAPNKENYSVILALPSGNG